MAGALTAAPGWLRRSSAAQIALSRSRSLYDWPVTNVLRAIRTSPGPESEGRGITASAPSRLDDVAEGNQPRPTSWPSVLGPLETAVMRVIWERSSATVGEVESALNTARSKRVAYKTILTICSRLEVKGLLGHEREGRAFRYLPTMSERDLVAREADRAAGSLLSRFGELGVSGFVNQVVTDPDRLAQLEGLLSDRDAGRRRS